MKNDLTTNKEQRTKNKGMKVTRNFKIAVIFLAFFFFHSSFIFGLDFILTPGGFVFVPMGQGSIDPDTGYKMYDVGGGGEVGFEADLSTIWPNPLGLGYTFGIEAAMLMNPLLGDKPENISLYSAGGGLGLYFYPLSRLLIRVDGGVGTYMMASSVRGTSDVGLFFRGGGKMGFRFTPAFTLAANAGWRQFMAGSREQVAGSR